MSVTDDPELQALVKRMLDHPEMRIDPAELPPGWRGGEVAQELKPLKIYSPEWFRDRENRARANKWPSPCGLAIFYSLLSGEDAACHRCGHGPMDCVRK